MTMLRGVIVGHGQLAQAMLGAGINPAAAPVGDKVTAICQPVHRGGRTMVWTTRIQRQGGRPVSVVTQTQMVLG